MTFDAQKYPLGRHIAVIGKGGKTTLSKALAERYDLEFIEQDEIRHQANWVELSNEEHIVMLEGRFADAENGWVSDGNYSSIVDVVSKRVDTVIALALPWRVMLWRTFWRTVKRRVTGEVLWNGNRESFRNAFLSRSSVVYDLWIRRDRFKTIAEMAIAQKPEGVELVIIRSTRELRDFYAEHGLVRR